MVFFLYLNLKQKYFKNFIKRFYKRIFLYILKNKKKNLTFIIVFKK